MGDSTITIKIPAKYEEIKDTGLDTSNTYSWGIKAGEDSSGNAQVSGQVTVNAQAHGMSSSELAETKTYMSSSDGKTMFDTVKQIYVFQLQTICKDVNVQTPTLVTVQGATLAIRAEYTCKSKAGLETEFKGVVIDALETKNEVTTLIMVTDPVWTKSKANIEETVKSISIK